MVWAHQTRAGPWQSCSHPVLQVAAKWGLEPCRSFLTPSVRGLLGGAVMALSLSWRSSVQAVTSYSEGVILKFSVSFSGPLPPEKPLIYTCTPCIFSVLVERGGGKGTQQMGPDSMSAWGRGRVLCHSRHVTRSSDSALARRASLTGASRAG